MKPEEAMKQEDIERAKASAESMIRQAIDDGRITAEKAAELIDRHGLWRAADACDPRWDWLKKHMENFRADGV